MMPLRSWQGWVSRPWQGGLEPLEPRVLLNADVPDHVFRTFEDQLDDPTAVVMVPQPVSGDDFAQSRLGTVGIGLHVIGDPDGGLDPAAVEVRDGSGNLVPPRYADPDLTQGESLTLVELPFGDDYDLSVTGERGTSGGFQLRLFLIGDADGDGHVDRSVDTQLVRDAFGSRLGETGYRVEADADLNGVIAAFDVTQHIRNIEARAPQDVDPDPLPPALAPIEDQAVDEGTSLTLPVTANDPDTPTDDLTFTLDPGAPDGTTIDPDSGEFTWTPTEAQGPGVFPITVRVTDPDGLSDTKTFTVTVNEVNQAPVLDPIEDQVVDEGQLLEVTASVSDPDLPANRLTYSLGEGTPAGVSIDPVTGRLTWTPTEADGPGEFEITVIVSDDGTPSLTDQQSFLVMVQEVNQPPVLDPIADQTLNVGETLDLTITASDPDLAPNGLSFDLLAGSPAGIAIDPGSGRLTWTPTAEQVGDHVVSVRVTDNGSPALDDTQSLTITVIAVDDLAPIVNAELANDTGRSDLPGSFSDGVTSDPTVAGMVTDDNTVTAVRVTLTQQNPGAGLVTTADLLTRFRRQALMRRFLFIGPVLPSSTVPADRLRSAIPSAAESTDIVDSPVFSPVDGSFTLDRAFYESLLGGPMADGDYTLTIEAEDESGNISDPFNLSFTLDTTPPAVSTPDLLPQSDTGVRDSDDITNDATPTVGVEAEADSRVRLRINDSAVDEGIAAGPLDFTIGPLAEGTHELIATAEDIAGNLAESDRLDIKIDLTPPAVSQPDLVAADDSGDSDTDDLTNVTEPRVEVSFEAGAEVRLSADGGVPVLPLTVNEGVAEFVVGPLDEGSHALVATAEDLAGNQGISPPLTVTVDVTPPALDVDLDPQFDSDPVGDGRTTSNPVSLIGLTEPNRPVELFDDAAPDVSIASTVSDAGNGALVFTGISLALGSNALTASTADAAGNNATAALSIIRDAIGQPPQITATLDNDTSPNPIACGFTDDLDGWTVRQTGGTMDGMGHAQGSDCAAVLTEGDSFVLALERTFVVPDDPTVLSFRFETLDFDTADAFVNDAFEVSLTDAQGRPLVFPVAEDHTAFFNISEDEEAALGSSVTVQGNTVNLDISAVAPGTVATLTFRLVNNDSDTQTSVRINQVTVPGVAEFSGVQSLPASLEATDTDGDGLTSDPTVIGQATDDGTVVRLLAGFDDTPVAEFVDVTTAAGLDGEGRFRLEADGLVTVFGGPLTDGAYVLHLIAEDDQAVTSPVTDVVFTLDTASPTAAVGSVETRSLFIDVVFDEPVADNAFTAAAYSLVVDEGPDQGRVVTLNSIESVDPVTARLHLDGPIGGAAHRLTLAPGVSDLAGNLLAAPKTFTVSAPPAVQVTEFSPFNGEEMVALTRQAVVHFDQPVDPVSVTDEGFYAIARGQRLAGTIRVSRTELFATLMFDQPLPSATEVRVVIDGDLILGRDGQPVDADGNGVAGGQTAVDFRTVPMTRIPGTNVTGRVFASEPDDLGNDVPLVGVTLRVDGIPGLEAVTAADGSFTLVDVPAPEFFVHIDGSTTISAGGTLIPDDGFFPVIGKSFHSVPGQTVQLEMNGEPFDIYLPFILNEAIQPVVPGQPTTVSLPEAQVLEDPDLALVSVTVPADSLINDDSTPGTQVGIFRVASDRLPAPLPDGLNHSFDITVQADAPNFDEPAPVTFPNTEGLTPGEKSLLMSFDHAKGEWVVVGTMTVSADGQTVTTDPGVGVRAPGWHGTQSGVVVRGGPVLGQRGGLFGRRGSEAEVAQTGRHFYAIENLDTGFVLRGSTNVLDRIFEQMVLGPNTRYRLLVLGIVTLQQGELEFETGASGQILDLDPIVLERVDLPHDDNDGLNDKAEFIVGTVANDSDTDNDGINDLAELRQGLDPSDGRAFPTGIIASLPVQGSAKQVMIEGSLLDTQGQTAYIATGSHGLAIVDATDFDLPILLGELDLPGDTADVSVDTALGIAAVASGTGGLHLIDVSDPMTPMLVRTTPVDARQVEVFEGVAYVAVGSALYSYDLLTGDRLQILPVGTHDVTGIARERTVLVTMDAGKVLRSVDISGFTMVERGSVQLVDGAGQVFVGNSIVYVAATSNGGGGFSTVDVSDPGLPVILSGRDVPPGVFAPGKAVVANGSGIGVVIGSPLGSNPRLDLLDVTDPSQTNELLTGIGLPVPPQGVALGGGIAYVADGSSGLQVVNYLPFDGSGQSPDLSIATTIPDADPDQDGFQVEVGTTMPIIVTASDDIQVRNVELLVDGETVANDAAFPFDFDAVALSNNPVGTTVTVQARATDTGGNIALSNEITLELTPDVTPPAIVHSDPADGGVRSRNLRSIRLAFSEPVAESTLIASNFELRNLIGEVVVPIDIQIRRGGRLVQLTYAQLAPDDYELRVRAPAVTDLAGNPMGDATLIRVFTVLDASIVFTNTAGGDWNNPANWEGGRLPTAEDDVGILLNNEAIITHTSGDTIVRSLTTDQPFEITGGVVTVTGSSVANNIFSVSNGATLIIDGQGAVMLAEKADLDSGRIDLRDGGILHTPNLTSINRVNVTVNQSGTFDAPLLTDATSSSLTALNGGVLSLPSLTTFAGQGLNATLRASGMDSRLELGSVLTMAGSGGAGAFGDARTRVEAFNGGVVDLSGVTEITGANTNVIADDPGSVVDFSSLGSWAAALRERSSLGATDGGLVLAASLSEISGVTVNLNDSGTVQLGPLSALRSSSLSANGLSLTFDQLTDATSSSLTALNGGVLSLPSLTTFAGQGLNATLRASGMDSRLELGSVLTMAGSGGAGAFGDARTRVEAFNGGVVDLSGVTEITGANTNVIADDPGSVVDFSSLGSWAAALRERSSLGATDGGLVLAASLSEISGVTVNLNDSGTVQLGPLSALRSSSLSANGLSLTFDQLTDATSSSLTALNGGVLSLPSLTTFAGQGLNATLRASGMDSRLELGSVLTMAGSGGAGAFGDARTRVEAFNGGVVDLSGVTEITGANTNVIADDPGSVVDFSSLGSWAAALRERSSLGATDGGLVLAASLSEISGVTVNLNDSGTVQLGPLSALRSSSLSANGLSLTFDQLTDATSSSLTALNGGVLSLPSLTTFAGQGLNATLRASGMDSRLELGSVLTMAGSGGAGAFGDARTRVEAFNGGVVDLSGVTEITGANTNVIADDPGSVVDFSSLGSWAAALRERSSLGATDGGLVLAASLSEISGVTVNLNDSGTVQLGPLSALRSSSLSANGLSLTFDQLTDATSSSLTALNGGVLSLPSLTTFAGQGLNATLRASGMDSRLELGSVLTMAGSGGAGAFGDARTRVEAFNGGVVDLSGVTEITGANTNVIADDPGSVVDFSSLGSWAAALRERSSLGATDGGLVLLPPTTVVIQDVTINLAPSGTLSAGTVQLDPGTLLTGQGSIEASVVNSSLIQPGSVGGVIIIDGDYSQTSEGALVLEVGGRDTGVNVDQIIVTGQASFGGTLQLNSANSFLPEADDEIVLISYDSGSSEFTTIDDRLSGDLVVDLQYDPTDLTLAFLDFIALSTTEQSEPAVTTDLEDFNARDLQSTALVEDLLALGTTSRGTDYWLTFPTNIGLAGENAELSLRIATQNATSGTVTIPGLDFTTSFDVAPEEVVEIEIPLAADLGLSSDQVTNKGIHVVSDAPVTVYGVSRALETTDAFLGLPVELLGTEHIILAYQNLDVTTDVFETFPGTEFALVATEDGTTVTITPSITTGTHEAGIPFVISLDAGQTYQLQNFGSEPSDLTGTLVVSNKPIAVFGGHAAANVPAPAVGFADYLVEQLPPVEAWASEFVTAPLATRASDTFRVLASQDGTTVTVDGIPAGTMDRGEFLELSLSQAAHIVANQPVLVAQYANSAMLDDTTSDPFMMLVPAVDQMLGRHTVTTQIEGLDLHFINLVVPTEAIDSVTHNGQLLEAGVFTPVAGSGFWVASLTVEAGTHELAAPQPFAAYVYGFGVDESYGYPAGLFVATPDPTERVVSVDLEPDTATLNVGATHTLAATALDENGDPVAGARVDFAVTGAHETAGFDFTDESGVARFSYTSLAPGDDTITAVVGSASDTVAMTWDALPLSLEIISPLNDDAFESGASVLVTGRAVIANPGATLTSLTVNGQPIQTVDAAGQFFTQVLVLPGENRLLFEATDSLSQSDQGELLIHGQRAPPGAVDLFTTELTASLQVLYGRTSLNEATQTLFVEVAVRNAGQFDVLGPLFVAIDAISEPGTRVLDPDGFTPAPDGLPFFELTDLVSGGILAPGQTTARITLPFSNPGGQRFTFQPRFFGQLNEAPQITSVPDLEAIAGRPYTYVLEAIDANDDAILFALDVAPESMDIDPVTGLVTWTPGQDDLGTHVVTVRAEDGRGGLTQQSFTLRVVDPPTNRPPLFTTAPVVDASANTPYVYRPGVADPDGDTLTFTLDSAPTGMTIDALTGELVWTPTADQLGGSAVAIVVSDVQGGSARQVFEVRVNNEPGNHAPLIVTEPVTTSLTGLVYTYDADAVDPDGDTLIYELVQAPAGMTIDSATGLILVAGPRR